MELVSAGNYCLADPGRVYAVYMPQGGQTSLQVAPGRYQVVVLNATTGERLAPTVRTIGDRWNSPTMQGPFNGAILLRRD